MNKIHKTREGETMFVSEMDDNHLENYIVLSLKAIEKIKNGLRVEQSEDAFQSALCAGSSIYDKEKLTDLLGDLTENLYPYLAEIALRGIDMSELLQNVFERNQKKETGLSDLNFNLLLSQF